MARRNIQMQSERVGEAKVQGSQSWQELQRQARKLGVYRKGMNRAQVEQAIAEAGK